VPAVAKREEEKEDEDEEGWSGGLSDKNIAAWFVDQEGK